MNLNAPCGSIECYVASYVTWVTTVIVTAWIASRFVSLAINTYVEVRTDVTKDFFLRGLIVLPTTVFAVAVLSGLQTPPYMWIVIDGAFVLVFLGWLMPLIEYMRQRKPSAAPQPTPATSTPASAPSAPGAPPSTPTTPPSVSQSTAPSPRP